MVLVTLPRFVLPTKWPFLPMETTVDRRLTDVNTAAIIEAFGKFLENAFENSLIDTLLESPMASLARQIALRNILLGCSDA